MRSFGGSDVATPCKLGCDDGFTTAEGPHCLAALGSSRHQRAYFWWTDATLCDTPLSELPDDIADRLAEVLKPFGYDLEAERLVLVRSATARSAGGVSASSIYRQANDDALANLDCWVPELHLYRWRRKPGGYEAVAHWRSSSAGRALELRTRNLSIVRKGIEDFGDGRKYTPIDLVMEARGYNADTALG